MVKMTKQQVLEKVKKENVSFINLQFTDVLGVIKAVTIPSGKLQDAIENGSWFDGSSIEGFARIFESDMFLKPDLDTFFVIPWTKDNGGKTARIICDVYMPDGSPFEGDPRYILKRQVEKAKKMGFTPYCGPELEFFILKRDEEGNIIPLPHDAGGYFDQSTDMAGEIRKEMTEALEEMGVEVETLHHEVAPGSHEIDFKYDELVATADNAVTFRYVLKAIAHKHGLHVTFMPKPIAGINGSGMHIHMSMFKNGENAFYDEKDDYMLSDIAKQFIAGEMKYVRDIGLLLNQQVNSYKRLVIGHEAPVYISWATTNRSALIRIPRVAKHNKNAVRIELRNPDPAANPYLAFAGAFAAGIRGVEEKLKVEKPLEENIYNLTNKAAAKRNIRCLAPDLKTALDEFKKSNFAKEIVGDHCFENLIRAKTAEWDSYRLDVSQWEIDRYMEVY